MRKVLLAHRGAITAVAKLAKVNKSIVSVVMRGRHGGRVSRETEDRILEMAKLHVVHLEGLHAA